MVAGNSTNAQPDPHDAHARSRNENEPADDFQRAAARALRRAPPPAGQTGCWMGVCVDNRHPVLAGRCLVEWNDPEGTRRQVWMPTLKRLHPQPGDRVLAQSLDNFPEPVVTGVLDGLREQPDTTPEAGPALRLKDDEALHIADPDGTPLLAVMQTENGPVLRLANDDLRLDLPGDLSVSARAIRMTAKKGALDMTATDDVNVKGETINLN